MTTYGEGREELSRTIRALALKCSQIIVQSRSGALLTTNCKNLSNGHAEWFNLAVNEIPVIEAKTKRAMQSDFISSHLPLIIEISVKNDENYSSVLEIWNLSVRRLHNDPVPVTNLMIYTRLGILLKSLITCTRVTPAYKISRRQGPDAYTMLYRIYMDKPEIKDLGAIPKHIRVGQVLTPYGTIHLAVSYRVDMKLSPPDNGLNIKTDHFKHDRPKKATNRNKHGAFAKGLSVEVKFYENDTHSIFPFGKLMNIPKNTVPQSNNNEKNAEICSQKSQFTRIANDNGNNEDFVMVQFKTPFGTNRAPNVELYTFYQSCEKAQELETCKVEQRIVCDEVMTKQLEIFETDSKRFDAFVKELCKTKTDE